ARHVDGDDPARDGLAPGGRAGRRWRALGGGDPADHEPALRALARRSDHFRDRRHRPGAGGAHRHVAAGLARLARGSAGRASLRVGTGSGYISLSDMGLSPAKDAGDSPHKGRQKVKCTPIVPLLLLAAASAAPIANGPSELLLALNKGDHTLAIVDAT